MSRVKYRIDWSLVDWSRSDHDIAKDLSTSPHWVYWRRRKLAPDTLQSWNVRDKEFWKDRINWDEVNWSETNQKIAARYKRSLTLVTWRRSLHAPETLGQTRKRRRVSTVDWRKLDWNRATRAIAEEIGRSENTVSKMRKIHAPETVGKFRSEYLTHPWRVIKRSELRKASNKILQPRATAAAKRSRKSGRGESNIHAKAWAIISPSGKRYRLRNLQNFVREHAELFAPADVEWKRQGGTRGTGGEYCNATAGLSNVRQGKSRAWKGWRLDFSA